MPRPRVKPQDRKRSVRACRACKASKKRCDSNFPCGNCVRRGIADTCEYSSPKRRTRPTELPPILGPGLLLSPQHSLTAAAVRPEARERDDDTRDTTPSIGQRPVMLYSSSGERGMNWQWKALVSVIVCSATDSICRLKCLWAALRLLPSCNS